MPHPAAFRHLRPVSVHARHEGSGLYTGAFIHFAVTDRLRGDATARQFLGDDRIPPILGDRQDPAINDTDLEADIVSSRAWLMGNGLRGYDHCAYPHGRFSSGSDVLGLARKYFTSCRTIFDASRESALPSDAEKLRVYLVSSTFSAATVAARIDAAVAHHQWMIVVIHNLTPGAPVPGNINDFSAESFRAIVDHAKSSGIAVKPVSEVLAVE